GCKILRVLFPVFAALNPPGNPCAEDEVAAIRRRVLRRSGGHMPSHLCVSKSATRIVRGRYSRIGMVAYEERPFARLRRDLEFGATKLLHLKVVIELAISDGALSALGFKNERGVAQVHSARKFYSGIEAAERVQTYSTLRNIVTARIFQS